ncbi:uncharacterized protein B0T15DRAFT_304553 [Chaetomium strumarium]|uniref:Uncharacterized protein n=1 Tax=Chaetomium strumarium TaxID=1170767 RepID=A0AAJ0GLZ1_9PEZI|nr:hypothetical protein B0T15DRAFT_304553 [Chaetomium strumarium]
MAIPHTLPAALGAISFLPTTAILGIQIILARSPADRASTVRITAIVAATLEAMIFVIIPCLSLSHIAPWAPGSGLRGFRSLWFGAGLVLCTIASAMSVASLVCLSRVVNDPLSTILGWRVGNFLVGSSVVLGLAFATQAVFFASHVVVGRLHAAELHGSSRSDRGSKRLAPRIKTIPYHETAPISSKSRGNVSLDSQTPPGSIAGRSTTETMSSIRSSLSNVVRPITSRTRLLSASRQSLRRSASQDLPGLREVRTRSVSDGFDSWDTSSIAPENRQTVLESSSPPLGRSLETIPASPTVSRSSSPGTPLDLLEPPRTRRRSRSYSPVSTRTIEAQRAAFTQQPAHSEAHIHPLFRSDSPIPPPSATPGTVVVAAPDAGKVISDRQSIRSIQSMRRLRSESLPTVPSPLSRAASLDSFHRRAESNSPEIREEIREEDEAAVERKMTPPIPDWILAAGSRSTLTVYNGHRSQTPGEGGEKLDAAHQV